MCLNLSIKNQAKRPRPRLMQGKTQSGNESEPFNLRNRVSPNKLDNSGLSSEASPPVSGKLLAAKEGCVLTAKSEAIGLQESGPHPIQGGVHLPHSYHPSSQDSSIPSSQQHAFMEQGPGLPPWQMLGAPYGYGTGIHGGWYNHLAAPYPPQYPPPIRPPYGPYPDGSWDLSAMLQSQNMNMGHPNAIARGPGYYFCGTNHGVYREPRYHRDSGPPPPGRTDTLPNVAGTNTAPPPSCLGDSTASKSPGE